MSWKIWIRNGDTLKVHGFVRVMRRFKVVHLIDSRLGTLEGLFAELLQRTYVD